MRKTIALCALILLYSCRSISQITEKNDAVIYQYLLNNNGIHNRPILARTSSDALKRVNFRITDLSKWAPAKRPVDKEWQMFLNQIKTDTLKDHKILSKIGSLPFTSKDYEPFVAFSPVLYSHDKTLAVCAVYEYTDREAASQTVFLLEYKDNRWIVVKYLSVMIS